MFQFAFHKKEIILLIEAIWLEYAWTLLILIGLEGLLSADNALVIAVIAKNLPERQKKRAINYGIICAFIFRFVSIFFISFLVNVWQVQAIGSLYLIYIGLKNIYKRYFSGNEINKKPTGKNEFSFLKVVMKIGLADIAFAIDSVLAAVALAITMPETSLPKIGGLDGGRFSLIVVATIAGLILIKFAASWFIKLIDKRPALEIVAYLIVIWVGVKLAIITLSHENVAILPKAFPHSTLWTTIFWGVLLGIAIIGWFVSGRNSAKNGV